jgi:hypothetical protein
MLRWLTRTLFFVCGMVAFRLIVGHFFPALGLPEIGSDLTKVKEKVMAVLPSGNFGPSRDQTPLAVADYRRMGFPDAGPAGVWARRDLTAFHLALASTPWDRRGSFPGADGDYGKAAFAKITRLESNFPSHTIEDQGEMVDLIAKIHETYRRANNEDRIQCDREISLLRGVYVAMTDQLLAKIESDMKHYKADIARATGTLGYGPDYIKERRKAMAGQMFQSVEGELKKVVSEVDKNIEGLLEDMVGMSSIRPQSKKLTLRYLERHLASIQRRIGGDYQKSVQKGYDRASDPEVKELYRRVLATLAGG